jgi:hypothetical protein
MIRRILRIFLRILLFGAGLVFSLVLLMLFVIFLFGVIYVFSIPSMFRVKKVVITRRYIINPNWSKNLPNNPVTIYKLHLADSSRPIIVDSIIWSRNPEYDPFKAFVRDTCTWFESSNILYNGTSFRKRKIYFDRPNGFKWEVYSCDSLDSTYRQSSWSPPPAKFERPTPADDSIGRRRRPQVFYTKRDTIGALELNRWYAFEGLTWLGHIYFVYVDSTGCTRVVRTLPPWFKPI